MRRQNRRVIDPDTIREILDTAQVFHLALPDPASPFPYVVPLNYGYEQTEGRLTLFFHGALAGRKYELLKDGLHPAGFSIDCRHRLVESDDPQETSYAYQSIIGEGNVRQLTDPREKRRALEVLMACLTKKPCPVSDGVADHTAVFALDVKHFDAKQNQPGEDMP